MLDEKKGDEEALLHTYRDFLSSRDPDLKAFFGAADDKDLQNRISQMVASTTAFGANENIDTVPTSRYVFKTPFKD